MNTMIEILQIVCSIVFALILVLVSGFSVTKLSPLNLSEVPDVCSIAFDAMAVIRENVHIFQGKYVWRLDDHGTDAGYPKKINTIWPNLPENITHVDAVYEWPLDSGLVNVVFFIGKQFYVFKGDSFFLLMRGYPKPLTSLGLPDSLDKLDAAMVWGRNNKTYFFSGSVFWRFDEEKGRVEKGYPRDMAAWTGIGYNIDSAFTTTDGTTYFVKGRRFWNFDNLKKQVEDKKQTSFAEYWLGCPANAIGTIETGNRSPPPVTLELIDNNVTTRRQDGICILPPYPPHATYTTNFPGAKPGDAFDIVAVNLTCHQGYAANRPPFIFCNGGQWSSPIAKCVPLCHLPPQPSVEYRCLVSLDWMDGFRACHEYEPSGTQVRPFCRTNYYSTTTLKFMHCINGEWSNIQKCTAECGTLIPNGTQLVLSGEVAKLGEVPWHAGIYTKTTQPYRLICGGSLIGTKTVISAAHCFWSNLLGKLPASDFAVAVGKLYRKWNSNLDNPQWSEVESVNLPVHFRGSATNYQDDVAVVVLKTAIEYNSYIRPVCLDFDINFEQRQLQPQNKGKVAGWGLTAENGGPSQVLRVVDLPYVSVQTCLDQSPASFTSYITSDKVCAGYNNGSAALCKGDSGGGLAFPELDRGRLRYYLRGVASTAPTSDNHCNAHAYVAFTRLSNHEHFVTRFWVD